MQTVRSVLVGSGITVVVIALVLAVVYVLIAALALVSSTTQSVLPKDLPFVSSGGGGGAPGSGTIND